jgi:uncharacterized membrane protein (UPF0127 family)
MSVLINVTTGTILATRIDRLSTFLQRAVGLLARPALRADEGVLITPCRAIHTIGMRIPIDVIFVDRNTRVIRAIPDVLPNRVFLGCRGAHSVFELGNGALREAEIAPGDRLALIP